MKNVYKWVKQGEKNGETVKAFVHDAQVTQIIREKLLRLFQYSWTSPLVE